MTTLQVRTGDAELGMAPGQLAATLKIQDLKSQEACFHNSEGNGVSCAPPGCGGGKVSLSLQASMCGEGQTSMPGTSERNHGVWASVSKLEVTLGNSG